MVHREAIWKVKIYNKPSKFKADNVQKLPYSTKGRRTGTDSDVGWYYQQWVRMLCKKNKFGNEHQEFANPYPKGFAYEVLYYCYR